jgi:hypothetical protein
MRMVKEYWRKILRVRQEGRTQPHQGDVEAEEEEDEASPWRIRISKRH